jgi:hypothetical protein
MILTAQKLFDFALIATTQAGTQIKPLVDYLNTNLEKIVRAVNGELTLQDNIKGQIVSTQLQHGIATSVACNSTEIHGITSLQCDADAISALNWQFDNKGALQLTAYFQSASATKRTCKFFVYFK